MITDKLCTAKQRCKSLTDIMRKNFEKNQKKLIAKWEKETGQIWPTLSSGSIATPHHIIPLKNGGSNAWWNLTPVNNPHTGTIHGKGSALRTHMPYGEIPGTIWNLC